jgi:predicted Fe-Mo cluster-binding NifX family protein
MKILLTVQDHDVAPRFDQATEVLIATAEAGRLQGPVRTIILPHRSAEELSDLIVKEGIDCLVCGGIEDSFYRFFKWKKIRVYDAVIGAHAEALELVLAGTLRPGMVLPSARAGQ